MSFSGLSFSTLPPISLAFRYFISAALFAILVAIIILFSAAEIWQSRWHPSMLAITHGLTLGFISSVMMGALLQILPVVGGVGLPKVKVLASACHLLHSFGTLCLILAFIWPNYLLQASALVLLGAGFFTYILACAAVLIKKLSQGYTIIAIRLALIALLVTVILGLLMQARSLGFEFISANKAFTDLHAVWGFAGWFSLLIIAMSFQIIVMFHVTPEFALIIRKYLPTLIAVILLALFFIPSGKPLFVMILLVLNTGFIGYLCYLLTLRKRKIADSSVNFWRLATVFMVLVLLLYTVPQSMLPGWLTAKYETLLAAIFIYGYVMAIIVGMLLKVIPFLSYTHLQQRCLMDFSLMAHLPNMHDFLAPKHGRLLFKLHILTSLALLLTLLYNQFYWLFGLLMLTEFSCLLLIILRCLRLYIRMENAISLAEKTAQTCASS